MKLVAKAKDGLKYLKNYWRVPPTGRYMPLKEIISLSVGGIGVKFIAYCIGNMMVSIGNSLIGNTIGIPPEQIYVIYVLSILSSFPLTALRARMIDNSKSAKGKYRPYLIRMGIPTVILGILFIWTPYEKMSVFWQCAFILLYNIGFQFFYNFTTDAYDSLLNVLSPNSIERSDASSVKSVIENFSPSIANIFLPIAANLITGDNNLYNLKVYRVLYPPMLIVGFMISILAYVNTQEKIVQAKTHVIQMNFTDAFRAIAKNKYFWVVSLAGWMGFLEGSFGKILEWSYNYRNVCSAGQYSLVTAIAGNASFWPNLVAPFLIRRYGKRFILVSSNLFNIVLIALMIPVIRSVGATGFIWILLAFMFVNQFMTSLGYQMNPSINADIRDYQQYVTGERIDGMFAAVGLIGSVISLFTSSVLPMIYEKAGLNETVATALGYENVYDVLYNEDYFVSICTVLIGASVIGAAMNVIPFFFYDLTETKQKAMVSVLKIRALFEDYGNNALTEESLKEAVDIIDEAKAFADKEPLPLTKENVKKAKKSGDKELVKNARSELKQRRLDNEKIEIGKIVLTEINRFETEMGKAELKKAEEVYAAGLLGITSLNAMSVKEARCLPKNTAAEKDYRKTSIDEAKKIVIARRAVKKYYPNGIEEFDDSVFEKLFAEEYKNDVALHDTIALLKEVNEGKKEGNKEELKAEMKNLQRIKNEISREIKKAMKQNSIYNRAAKPYLDAKKLLKQAENYKKYDEIVASY